MAGLPAVERVLIAARASGLDRCYAESALAEAARDAVAALRARMIDGREVDDEDLAPEAVAAKVAGLLETRTRPRVRAVVNATGVILHTNLGRAPLAESAARAAYEAGRRPVALEFDLDHGRRGERDRLVEEHLCALTGAEAATVVGNNAGAVLLALSTVAAGGEVVVSRGELVEIGGSFRIPEIMKAAGTTLREVGTTNRTHAADYSAAIGDRTRALLKVHASNYRVVGFTAAVALEELVALASPHDLPVIEDLGSGALLDTALLGIPSEPLPGASIAAGASIVTFSGDKLLGGPQCGILVGERRWIEAARRNPLKRALRPDKMILAALEETLRLVRFAPDPIEALPSLRAMARPAAELENMGARSAGRLAAALGEGAVVEAVAARAQVGSGAQPTVDLASVALAVTVPGHSAAALADRFRASDPPILGRVEKDRFLLDLRWIEDPEELVPSWADGAP
jgi:L-seryl-tRNA(Ser) seleniumtransferase